MVFFKMKTIPEKKFPPGVVICHPLPTKWINGRNWTKSVDSKGMECEREVISSWISFEFTMWTLWKRPFSKPKQTLPWYLVDLPVCYSHLKVSLDYLFKDSLCAKWTTWMHDWGSEELVVTSRQPPSALGSMNHGKSFPKIWLLTHLRNAVFQKR